MKKLTFMVVKNILYIIIIEFHISAINFNLPLGSMIGIISNAFNKSYFI